MLVFSSRRLRASIWLIILILRRRFSAVSKDAISSVCGDTLRDAPLRALLRVRQVGISAGQSQASAPHYQLDP